MFDTYRMKCKQYKTEASLNVKHKNVNAKELNIFNKWYLLKVF